MLVAQSKNEDGVPIYGVTISGENWRFLVLEGRNYDISSSYSAGSKDIYDIFRILKKLKELWRKGAVWRYSFGLSKISQEQTAHFWGLLPMEFQY